MQVANIGIIGGGIVSNRPGRRISGVFPATMSAARVASKVSIRLMPEAESDLCHLIIPLLHHG
jgi:hypothetical protein